MANPYHSGRKGPAHGRRLTLEQAKANQRGDMRPPRMPGRTLAGAFHHTLFTEQNFNPMTLPDPPDLSPVRPPVRPRTLKVGLARGRRPR